MAKIHRSDAPLPQAPSVQVKTSYTVTDLSKVSPQEIQMLQLYILILNSKDLQTKPF